MSRELGWDLAETARQIKGYIALHPAAMRET
jgi:hypothetical protein